MCEGIRVGCLLLFLQAVCTAAEPGSPCIQGAATLASHPPLARVHTWASAPPDALPPPTPPPPRARPAGMGLLPYLRLLVALAATG